MDYGSERHRDETLGSAGFLGWGGKPMSYIVG